MKAHRYNMSGHRGSGRQTGVEGQKGQTLIIKWISSGVMYSMVTYLIMLYFIFESC